MKPTRIFKMGSGGQNFILSDLFFGLGAVLLIIIAALSVSLQGFLDDLASSVEPASHDTLRAFQSAAVPPDAPLLLAAAEGIIQRRTGAADTTIPLTRISRAPALDPAANIGATLIIAPDGQEAAFGLFARWGRRDAPPLTTLRLSSQCRRLAPAGPNTWTCAR